MKKRARPLALLLALALALSLCACGSGAAPEATEAPQAQSDPQEPAAEAAETPEAEAEPTPAAEPEAEPENAEETESEPIEEQSAYDLAVEVIEQEFIQVREQGLDDFDESLHPELPWYTALLTRYPENSFFKAFYDFDGNGVPELVIGMGGEEIRPVGVYAFDGRDMHYLCAENPVGERSHLSRHDGLFVLHGSGGASSGILVLFTIAEDGWSTELVDEFEYEYDEAGQVTYTSQLGVLSPEELVERGLPESEGLEAELDWECFLAGEGQSGFDMPNPWTFADSAAAAAEGAGLADFVAPEELDGFGPVRWGFLDGVAQAEYNNVNDQMLIRKAAGEVEISGDYTEYPDNWIFTWEGVEISCSGYGADIHRAAWSRDGFSYSLTIDPGIQELIGLTQDDLISLLEQVR